MPDVVEIGELKIGGASPLIFFIGPCVIENADTCIAMAEEINEICLSAGVNWVFKASFDKANRTSLHSFRGPGLEEGLKIMSKVRKMLDVPIMTDVHLPAQAALVAEVCDVVQIPALLCRQTDLVVEVARRARTVNIKKGQFLAPWDMRNVIEKAYSAGNSNVIVTERGYMFGYNNLVTDFRALPIMRDFGCPVVFDATHSVQMPGGKGDCSGGAREYVIPLARAATAVGCDGLFIEVHPRPEEALSDGPNSLNMEQLKNLIDQAVRIDSVLRKGN